MPPKVEGTWSCPSMEKYLVYEEKCFLFLDMKLQVAHNVVTAGLKN